MIKKYSLLLSCLFGFSSCYATSEYAACTDDEGDKTFIADVLAKGLASQKKDAVTITYEDVHTVERALRRNAHLSGEVPSAGFAEAQKDYFHKSIAQSLMIHPSLKEVHLTFEMASHHLADYRAALTIQMGDATGRSDLRVLNLDITSFVGLIRNEAFASALRHAPALEEVNIHNIHMGDDECGLLKLLDLLSENARVKHLGLYEVPVSLGGISKLRLTGGVLSRLGRKQYETLTLDTLGVEGIEECFIAYIRGLNRPQTLRVKGDIYVDHARAGFVRTALRGYGDRYLTTSGKVFAHCPTLNIHREVKDFYAR